MAKNYNNQKQTIQEGKMGFFRKLLTSIYYCWPFSAAIDVTELPLIKEIPFTNQRIVTDDDNYDIYLYFKISRGISRHILKYPKARIYTKLSRISFFEFLLYDPFICVFPKQYLSSQFYVEKKFFDRQTYKHLYYRYLITVDYHLLPLIIMRDLSKIDRVCPERDKLEQDIKDKAGQLTLAVLGYIYTNSSSSDFKLDDFQGTDIADRKFLSLIQTFQNQSLTTNNHSPHLRNMQTLPFYNTRTGFQPITNNNLPSIMQDNTTFQQVEGMSNSMEDKENNRYSSDHCYVKLQSIKFCL